MSECVGHREEALFWEVLGCKSLGCKSWMVLEECWNYMRREHTDAVNSIAVSPEGTLLASASWDSSLRIWPTGTPMPFAIHSAKHGPSVCCHARHNDL